jgi:hypothetical protein
MRSRIRICAFRLWCAAPGKVHTRAQINTHTHPHTHDAHAPSRARHAGTHALCHARVSELLDAKRGGHNVRPPLCVYNGRLPSGVCGKSMRASLWRALRAMRTATLGHSRVLTRTTSTNPVTSSPGLGSPPSRAYRIGGAVRRRAP